ncbi:MAG: hypothetical protein DPW21_00890 [Anaerolineae bacterium]|nr:hypothetical protein [Chloroflexi bacterium CFX2]MCQ3945236.1 hypothetical protein [Anaerolineae bacterium]GER79073.1 hypothetical protein DIM_11540 [Candidatus Denitrolinea symbiosum]HPO85081.1 hypothetical protein [Candidatus Hydrogenedentota bacterium]
MSPKRITEPSRTPDTTTPQRLASESDGTQNPCPIDLDSLTPLQRQRLDAAVRMLIHYLVSASAGGGDML